MSQEGLLEALLQQSGDCCTLSSAAAVVMARVRRLFFMSERQDLSRFLVTDLGITRYPDYRQIFCLPFLPFIMIPTTAVLQASSSCENNWLERVTMR